MRSLSAFFDLPHGSLDLKVTIFGSLHIEDGHALLNFVKGDYVNNSQTNRVEIHFMKVKESNGSWGMENMLV